MSVDLREGGWEAGADPAVDEYLVRWLQRDISVVFTRRALIECPGRVIGDDDATLLVRLAEQRINEVEQRVELAPGSVLQWWGE